MGKHTKPNPAKLHPRRPKRTAADFQRADVACLECYDTHNCPNCGNHPIFKQGCTVCGSSGKCPHCAVK
jgi:predicted RNA-binding Zn-ribbon protein involved in translation (DUF1610 family)